MATLFKLHLKKFYLILDTACCSCFYQLSCLVGKGIENLAAFSLSLMGCHSRRAACLSAITALLLECASTFPH